MPDRLPGMPLSAEDVHVCFDIGAEHEDQLEQEAPAAPPVRPVPRPGAWLVAGSCRSCNPRTGRMCRAHDTTGSSTKQRR